jgi:ribonucleotide reductase alpha subunit
MKLWFKVVLTDKGLELMKKTREELLEQYKGWNYEGWSNLAKVTYKRTYARPTENGQIENWPDTCARVIDGNTSLVDPKFIKEGEQEQMMKFMMSRKMTPAGRGLWMSGSKAADKFGGNALNNCWVTTSDDWENYVMAQDLLMLGGGVGMSVEHRFTCRLPEVKSGVKISHIPTKDADFIVPDTRQGWCELTRKVLKSYFVTGKSFTYSTVCIRGAGEIINGFGGKASGPLPLISFVENLCAILKARENKHMRPIDAADVLCAIAHMVVAGNVRRSALMVLGDPWDKEFLTIKRWDLIQVPAYRYRANFSVVASDFEDLHPLFWASYNEGEPIGIFNRKNAQMYGRMGELKKDKCVGVNPCKPLYSTILTKDGYVTFEQALKKDSLIVMGIDGKWKEASKPFKTGEKRNIYKMLLSNGTSIYGTENHEHMDADGNWKRLDQFEPGDRMKFSGTAIYDTAIQNESDYNDGIFAGWVHGDGWFSKREDNPGSTVGMCLGINEFDLTDYFEKQLQITFKPHGQKTDTCKFFASNRTDLAHRLESFGMTYDKSDLTWLYGKSKEFKLGFIRAAFTTDGSVRKANNVELYSSRPEALEVISNLLREFGIYNTTTIHSNAKSYIAKDGKERNNSISYKINVYAGQFKKIGFLSKFKNDLLGKQEVKPIYRYSDYVTIIDIDPEYDVQDVYDITVYDDTHAFYDVGVVTHNCAEATLEDGEPCNLVEIFLSNLDSVEEFVEAAKLATRMAIRTTCTFYTHKKSAEVIARNRRIGVGITGLLNSPLFTEENLDLAYKAIDEEAEAYCAEMGIPKCIKTTVIKPSGTVSKVGDCLDGCHPAYSKYIIQRIRFSSSDDLVPLLRAAGHNVEMETFQDGKKNPDTVVVDFYVDSKDAPAADGGFDTWKQLDVLLKLQKHWADQAVSITVYYTKENLEQVKVWLKENISKIKSISFLLHQGHGFIQAPKEPITEEQYLALSKNIRELDISTAHEAKEVDNADCEGGFCPIK